MAADRRRGAAMVAALAALVATVTLTAHGPAADGAVAQAGTVTVTPSAGIEPGDTVTVDGSALPLGTASYVVHVCTDGVAGVLGSTNAQDYAPYCRTQTTRLTASVPTKALRVGTPAWAYAGVIADTTGADQAHLVAIDVTAPAAPHVEAVLPATEFRAGRRSGVSGYVWPVPEEVAIRACQAVPADAGDPAAVEAACAEPETVPAAWDGSYAAPTHGRRLALGDVGLWVGADTPDGPAATFVPLTVVPGGPLVTVTPSTGLEVGDTIRIEGTGLEPDTSAFFVHRHVVACRADLPVDPPPAWTSISGYCRLFDIPQAVDTESFTAELTVESPGWAYVGLFDPFWPDNTFLLPVEVDAPPGLHMVARLVDDALAEGDVPAVAGYVWPRVDPIRARRCQAVPADPLDPAAVDAACRPGTANVASRDDGTFDGIPLFETAETRARVGDVGLWVGDGQAVAAFLPHTVDSAAVTVTPAEDLAVNQVVQVEASGFAVGSYYLYACDGAVVDGTPVTVEERAANCTDRPLRGGFVGNADGGRMAFEYQVAAGVTVGPEGRRVACATGPGACAVVVGRAANFPADDWVPMAGAALTLGTAPPLPLVVPGATTVTEGDAGQVTAHVPVRLSAPAAVPVTVRYATFDQQALPWAATARPTLGPPDYLPTEGTITFAPGETSTTVPVEVLGDTSGEADEMVLLGVTTPVGAGVGGYAGIGGVVVTDDD